jgi:hypothetical protein
MVVHLLVEWKWANLSEISGQATTFNLGLAASLVGLRRCGNQVKQP